MSGDLQKTGRRGGAKNGTKRRCANEEAKKKTSHKSGKIVGGLRIGNGWYGYDDLQLAISRNLVSDIAAAREYVDENKTSSQKDLSMKTVYPGVVECLVCKIILVSFHRHDFKRCVCKNGTFVDGGTDYLRYGGVDMAQIRPLRIVPFPKRRKK